MDPNPARSTPQTRRILAVALAVYLGGAALAGFQSRWNLVDDALILCRYGLNAAAGHGPVYNPGEPVEAHSSPLWVALLTLGARGGMDLPYLTRALGVLAGAAAVTLAAFTFGALFPPFMALMLTLMIAGDAGPAVWGIAGLETNGFMLILFAVWIVLRAVLERPGTGLQVLLGGLAGLLSLSRPEGAPLGALAVATSFAAPTSFFRKITPIVPFALIVGAMLAWRLSFYGALFPTSVTGKFLPRPDGLAHGLVAISAFLFRRWPLVLTALCAIVTFRRPQQRPDVWSVSAALACLFLIVETVLAGGDWMGRDRLPGPILPLLVMLAGFGLMRVSAQGGPAKSLLLLLAAAVISFSWWHADWIPQHQRTAARLGEWLRASLPAETRLGVAAAGTVPYFSGFYTVDALGISHPGIAATQPPPNAPWKPGHMRYDTTKFLATAPDVIVWEFGARWCLSRLAEPPRDPGRRGGDFRRELLWSPEFRATYRIMSGTPPETEALYSVFQRIEGGATMPPHTSD